MFRRQKSLHNLKKTGVAASDNTKAMTQFPQTLSTKMRQGNHLPEFTYDLDERAYFLEENAITNISFPLFYYK